jgi:hypothetical protein
MQLILGNVSIFKPMPFPAAGTFAVNAWLWNAIYTADPNLLPRVDIVGILPE